MNVKDAERVVEWCGALERDSQNRAIVIHCPAHPSDGFAMLARVALNFRKDSVIACCNVIRAGQDGDGQPCKAAAENKLCYHAIAAIMFRAKEVGSRTWFYPADREQQAKAGAARWNSYCFKVVVGDVDQGWVCINDPTRERQGQQGQPQQGATRTAAPVAHAEDPIEQLSQAIAALTAKVDGLAALPEQVVAFTDEITQLRQRMGAMEERLPRKRSRSSS